MKRLLFPFIILAALLVGFRNDLPAQRLLADTAAPMAYQQAVSVYNSAFQSQLRLFNGREYTEYNKVFLDGQPYYLTTTWLNAKVDYDGNAYDSVQVMYNLVTDELIVLNSDGTSKIRLLKDRVASFDIDGHHFVNVAADSMRTNLQKGFYDVVADGHTTMLVRRTKLIETLLSSTVEYRVSSKDRYYLRINDKYVQVRTKNDVLNALGDKKKELRQFIKANKIRFRRNPELGMQQIVTFYNQAMK
jgi:hypothetical protein